MYTVIDEVPRGTGYLKGVAMVVACRFLTTFILREMYYLSEEPPSLLLVARVGRPTRVLTNTLTRTTMLHNSIFGTTNPQLDRRVELKIVYYLWNVFNHISQYIYLCLTE